MNNEENDYEDQPKMSLKEVIEYGHRWGRIARELEELLELREILEEQKRAPLRRFIEKTSASTFQSPQDFVADVVRDDKPKGTTHGDAIAGVRDALPSKDKRPRKPKRADMAALAEAMVNHVKKNPGCDAESIRAAIGAKKSQMPTLRALAGHAVKLKGAKRAARYWPRWKGGK